MGVGVILSEALRGQGVRSCVVASAPHPFGFKEDVLLPSGGGLGHLRRWMAWQGLRSYDIFHNHDVALPGVARRYWSGRIVQHYHDPKVTVPVEGAQVSLVSLPGILRVVTDGIWIPLPARPAFFEPRPPKSGRTVVRVGYNAQSTDPTKPQLIPQAEIEAAVGKCGAQAELAPLRGIIDHAGMLEYYHSIDVWVDRIGCDFYGFAAVEAAAAGVPVVTQIGEFERGFVPDCPFVSVQRDSVESAIMELIGHDVTRESLGVQAREYASKVHHADVVARQCIEQYRQLLKGQ